MQSLSLPEHSVTRLDTVHCADALAWLRGAPSDWLNCVVTSPPFYGLRDYNAPGQIGLEDTPEQYVARLVALFREVRRVLRPDGVLWLNLGDSYATSPPGNKPNTTALSSGLPNSIENQEMRRFAQTRIDKTTIGLKPKNLIGIPWRVAFALQADGWYLRSDIIWHKPNPMPESVTDRPTKAHEYVFLLTKSERYFYDHAAIMEPLALPEAADGTRVFGGKHKNGANVAHARTTGRAYDAAPNGRNRRTVWTVPTEPKPFAHFAMFPQALIEPMVLAGCPAQVCAVCGAPYERVVEREAHGMHLGNTDGKDGALRNDTAKWAGRIGEISTRTLGFRPTCSCAANTRPGIVYDPFMGSGTSGLVAQRLGRHYIGTDINREYVELARRRLQYRGDDRRMVREQEAGVQQISLFDGVGT